MRIRAEILVSLLFVFGCSSGSGSNGGNTVDTKHPTVSGTSPISGAINVPVDTSISATFSEAMNASTINTSTFTLNGGVTGQVIYNGVTAIYTPSANLAPNTMYTATITTGVTDLAGNPMSSNYIWTFTTASAGCTPPVGVVTVKSSGANTDSTLGIPRYKIFQDAANPCNIWVCFQATGDDTYFSVNGGNNWIAMGRGGWEYHVSMSADVSGNIHFTNRNPGGVGVDYRRLKSPAGSFSDFDPVLNFDDYSGLAATGNVYSNGNEVFVFTRVTSPNALMPVVWHRSTDGGRTFTSSGTVCTPGSIFHRIGSCTINGQAAVFVWEAGNPKCKIRMYLWDGSGFVPDSDTVLTASTSQYTREYAVTQTDDGNIHIVWWDDVPGSGICLRHTYKMNGAGNWSTPVVIDIWNNNDISPQITHRGNQVYVFYRYNAGVYTGIYYKTWDQATGWSIGRIEVSEPSTECRYPQVPQHIFPTAPFLPVIWSQGSQIRYKALVP